MQRLQAFQFAISPTADQLGKLARYSGSCRYVWNRALALQRDTRAASEKHLSYPALCKHLTAWRNDPETTWLAETPCCVLQQALKDLCTAYGNFFAKRAEFPRFKRKSDSAAMRFPAGVKLDQAGSRLCLPKLGWIRYRNSREIVGLVRSATVRFHAGRWFISILTLQEVQEPVHPPSTTVGIDLGVVRLATLSDGTVVPPCPHLARHELRLRKAQQQMSRKKKFSANWRKAKARVARIAATLANTRLDYLHKTTTAIARAHGTVALEDLKVTNMTRSAAGTMQKPGRNVRQKAGLNRAILSRGWGEFRRQLEYKQRWRGGHVVAVPAHNTSRTCPSCGHVDAANRPSQAVFTCTRCGLAGDADLIAAGNILQRALIDPAERSYTSHPQKQL